jgi:hypothetical protein
MPGRDRRWWRRGGNRSGVRRRGHGVVVIDLDEAGTQDVAGAAENRGVKALAVGLDLMSVDELFGPGRWRTCSGECPRPRTWPP